MFKTLLLSLAYIYNAKRKKTQNYLEAIPSRGR
jgi:hypothetical protein